MEMPVWMAIAVLVAFVVVGMVGLVRQWRTPTVDPDRAVLEQLQKAGSNLNKPHDVEFFLLFRTHEAAQTAANELSQSGYATHADSAGTKTAWFCKATTSLVPELDALRLARRHLSTLANRLGGRYDGWGTPIVK